MGYMAMLEADFADYCFVVYNRLAQGRLSGEIIERTMAELLMKMSYKGALGPYGLGKKLTQLILIDDPAHFQAIQDGDALPTMIYKTVDGLVEKIQPTETVEFAYKGKHA